MKPDIKRASGGHRIKFVVAPRSALVRVTFDGSDPKGVAPLSSLEIDAPDDASKLRVVAEISGQFSPEETAPLRGFEDGPQGAFGRAKPPLKPDLPATLTTRIEPKDTAQAFSALDRLSKTPGAVVLGGKIELNGGRSGADFIDIRLGRDVGVSGADLDVPVESLVDLSRADSPRVKSRLDNVSFPSGRELSSFCDLLGEDFERITFKQDE